MTAGTVRVTAGTAVGRLRGTFEAGTTRPLVWRRQQLRALMRMLAERAEDFTTALAVDLGKSPTESFISELAVVRAEAKHAVRHLPAWAAPVRVPVPIGLRPASASVTAQPLGVALIIAPWNYPAQLVLAPLVGALAAGNCAVLKPSELAPATSKVLARLVPQYLDPDAVAVVEGGPEVTTELLEQRFDAIFFTGGERVGRIVAEAAARNLTPVTLELGGKSPAVVMDGDLDSAARRLVQGKFLNAGQTCVAPDYVLTTPALQPGLVEALRRALKEFYGDDPSTSADYGRIVNAGHFDRLTALLRDGTVAAGGRHDRATRYLEPTLLTGVSPESALMQEEIFGPLLPVLTVPDLTSAVRFITARPTPLAAYLFSNSPERRTAFENAVRAGGITHNACLVQLAVPGLPFGGVGASGSGSYHGQQGFDTFSQHRPVFTKDTRPDTLRVAYPPFGPLKRLLLRRLI
ncbi:aldehyde dehydrogenase family protein [Arthrobacter sp. MSA 4-2]|uniref:aldehyde dehydrogenase family protein n=1 Tax=Arthrobacter sp. MSA 4-2 TaxID=2794349 RepID=UPI0018E76462|nr:aldehyde dehydrogenase family protein [Arthrobacter sp. MSA 4-2]MBJ2120674.1 aldehyde dehydrogenase family protein [Arthrobacter sp. MSA 4-2]